MSKKPKLVPVTRAPSCFLSACDNKPAGLKAPTPVQCGSSHPAGPPPIQRQLQPPAPQLTNNCPPSHIPALSPNRHHNLPPANQSQQFTLPRPPVNCPTASFSTEQRSVPVRTFYTIEEGNDPNPQTSTRVFPRFRFLRQLSEPCLSFLPPEKTANAPYQPSSHDRRPVYQRHLSEPLVPQGSRALKQELVDPRYPDPGLPAPGLAQPPATFSHVTIKQEPRDFSFDSGAAVCYIYSQLRYEFSSG